MSNIKTIFDTVMQRGEVASIQNHVEVAKELAKALRPLDVKVSQVRASKSKTRIEIAGNALITIIQDGEAWRLAQKKSEKACELVRYSKKLTTPKEIADAIDSFETEGTPGDDDVNEDYDNDDVEPIDFPTIQDILDYQFSGDELKDAPAFEGIMAFAYDDHPMSEKIQAIQHMATYGMHTDDVVDEEYVNELLSEEE